MSLTIKLLANTVLLTDAHDNKTTPIKNNDEKCHNEVELVFICY